MQVKNIAHVAYVVSDMEKSLRFYCDCLGFERSFTMTVPQPETLQDPSAEFLALCEEFHGQKWIEYLKICDRQFVELFYPLSDQPRNTDTGIGYNHLSLEVNDIHAAAQELKAKGVTLTSSITMSADNTYQVWMADPDGNRIEMMQYTEKSLQVL
jgi:catechol 2,3-dioxygenase-like lactoylglutathione lyase family enzyme